MARSWMMKKYSWIGGDGCHGQGYSEDGDHPIVSYMPRGLGEKCFEERAEVDFDADDESERNDDDEKNEILDYCFLPKNDYY